MLGKIRDKLDGAANPIMLKEMWQSVHSKVTMAFFWLLLGVALLFYCLFATQEGSPSGDDMFVAFSFLMGGMAVLVIPILTYSSLYREITSNTIELLQITAMSAAQLVRGRLLASGVRILLLFSLVAPFAVTSFLFGGVDLTTVLATVYSLLVVAVAASAVAVLFSSADTRSPAGARASARWRPRWAGLQFWRHCSSCSSRQRPPTRSRSRTAGPPRGPSSSFPCWCWASSGRS